MNCQEYKKHIFSFLDGELPQDLANELKEHLKVCEICAKEMERLKMINILIEGEKAELKPDPFMSARVLSKLSVPNSVNNNRLRYITIASLAAAGLAIGILIGTLYSSSTSISENSTNSQVWEQLANEYMPEVENNPYNMVTTTNEIPQKP